MKTSFPKIFALGTKYISDIFSSEVEVTEKVDGSQFGFGKIDGQLYLRSKGEEVYIDNCPKMFKLAVEYVASIQNRLPNDLIFYCEYLSKPKHNTLNYGRVPKNNLILFGVCDKELRFKENLQEYADLLDIEVVPILFKGKVESVDNVYKLIERESILGNTQVEGIVVKNYSKEVMCGGQVIPIATGKYVSEKFKEIHGATWNKENKTGNRIEFYFQSLKTEARWQKAVQHLEEKGLLTKSPKDIGILMKEANQDIVIEEKENIKEFLWGEYKGEISRIATRGLPEWYKKKLMEEGTEFAPLNVEELTPVKTKEIK